MPIFRHKYIHGARIKEYDTNEEQGVLSNKIDDLVRKVLKKVFKNDLHRYKEDGTDIRDWFEVLDRMS